MDCPRCGEDLEARHQGGVEIDVCPRCGGVWLDRGEMDKLLYEDDEAVIGAPEDAPAVASPSMVVGSVDRDRRRDDHSDSERRRKDKDRDRGRDDDDGRSGKKRKKRKKESFVERLADALEDIFD